MGFINSSLSGTNSSHRKKVDMLWSYDNAPYIKLFQTTGSTFYELTFNGEAPSSKFNIIKYSPNNKYILCGLDSSPYFKGYNNDSSYSNLGSLSTSPGGAVDRWNISIRSDSTQFAIHVSDTTRIYSLPGLQLLHTRSSLSAFRIYYSNHDNRLAIATTSSVIVVNTNDFTSSSFNSAVGNIQSIAWSTDDKCIYIVGDSANWTMAYNIETTATTTNASSPSSPLHVFPSKDGKFIITTKLAAPYLTTLSTSSLTSVSNYLPDPDMFASNHNMSRDGKYLLLNSYTNTPYVNLYYRNVELSGSFSINTIPFGVGFS